MPTWGMWAVVVGLLLIRGLLNAVEASLQSLSDAQIKEVGLRSPRGGRRLGRLKSDPEATAAALRTGMVLSGFTAAAIGVLVPPRLLDLTIETILARPWLAWLTPLSSALMVAIAATAMDMTMRSYAVQQPVIVARSLSWVGSLTVSLLYPLVTVLVFPVRMMMRAFGAKVSFQPPPPSLEQLEKMLTVEAQKEEVDQNAPQLIRSIFRLSDKTCQDVMVPRTDVVSISVDSPTEQMLRIVAEENHSRLPVYRDDLDKIIGILHVRDVVAMMEHPELIVLHDLIRPAVYVPWVKPIGDLLRDMQKQHIHMAVVVDEYGGFSGIVTLEDILREIVGDIGDEFEEDEKTVEKQHDGSFLVDAFVPREEFAKTFDFQFPDGEFETLGGFLSSLASAIPELGERFFSNGFTFVVHSKEGARLDKIRVSRPKTPDRRPSQESLPSVHGKIASA